MRARSTDGLEIFIAQLLKLVLVFVRHQCEQDADRGEDAAEDDTFPYGTSEGAADQAAGRCPEHDPGRDEVDPQPHAVGAHGRMPTASLPAASSLKASATSAF